MSNASVEDEVVEAHKSYVEMSFTTHRDPEALKMELLQKRAIRPVLGGHKDPYWPMDPVQVSFFITALAFMSDNAWYDLKAESFAEYVFPLLVPESWTLELPYGIVERKVFHGGSISV